MEESYYIVVMIGGLEPVRWGAYASEEEQDAAAKIIHKQLAFEDNLFWLTIEDGEPFMGAYQAGFFEDNNEVKSE